MVIRMEGLKHALVYWSMMDDLPTFESPVIMYLSTVRGILMGLTGGWGGGWPLV